jgi:hypothetical protein
LAKQSSEEAVISKEPSVTEVKHEDDKEENEKHDEEPVEEEEDGDQEYTKLEELD